MQLKLKLVLLHKAKGVRLNLKHHMSRGSLKRKKPGKAKVDEGSAGEKEKTLLFLLLQAMSWQVGMHHKTFV
jgi:hypothetical protein